jgi:hypothetical protein
MKNHYTIENGKPEAGDFKILLRKFNNKIRKRLI